MNFRLLTYFLFILALVNISQTNDRELKEYSLKKRQKTPNLSVQITINPHLVALATAALTSGRFGPPIRLPAIWLASIVKVGFHMVGFHKVGFHTIMVSYRWLPYEWLPYG